MKKKYFVRTVFDDAPFDIDIDGTRTARHTARPQLTVRACICTLRCARKAVKEQRQQNGVVERLRRHAHANCDRDLLHRATKLCFVARASAAQHLLLLYDEKEEKNNVNKFLLKKYSYFQPVSIIAATAVTNSCAFASGSARTRHTDCAVPLFASNFDSSPTTTTAPHVESSPSRRHSATRVCRAISDGAKSSIIGSRSVFTPLGTTTQITVQSIKLQIYIIS